MSQMDFESAAGIFHRNLPDRLRRYLRSRGLSNEIIDRHRLGWNGQRITMPIPGPDGRVAFFRLARDPDAPPSGPKMLASPGSRVELYGWEVLRRRPERLVVAEGEFDRLVLESQGFEAVTSTGGALSFPRAALRFLAQVPELYLAFDRDRAGEEGARRLAMLLPQARVVTLPEEVGEGGDLTDFFARLRHDRQDFLALLAAARPLPGEEADAGAAVTRREIEMLKAAVPIAEVLRRSLSLRASGRNYVALCPFHDDREPSLVAFPDTNTFHCFGCGIHGDALAFLQAQEGLTFPEALAELKRMRP